MNEEEKNITIDLYGDGVGSVQLIESYGSDLTVVNAARVSFGNTKTAVDDRDRKLIKYLIKNRHTSTLEHCGITCKFTVPMYIAHQHMRHRTWSYNMISRRYTDADIKFYIPQLFRTQHTSNRQASNSDVLCNPAVSLQDKQFADPTYYSDVASNVYKQHMTDSLELYNALLQSGVCREQARGVLPHCMYTEYYGTVNLHNALNFIDQRTHEGAQWEIQVVAKALETILTSLFPETMTAWHEINDKKLGSEHVKI